MRARESESNIRTTFVFTVAQFELHFISACVYVCLLVRLTMLFSCLLLLYTLFCGGWWSVQIGCFGVFCTIFEINYRNLLGVSLILECRTCDEQLMAVA